MTLAIAVKNTLAVLCGVTQSQPAVPAVPSSPQPVEREQKGAGQQGRTGAYVHEVSQGL